MSLGCDMGGVDMPYLLTRMRLSGRSREVLLVVCLTKEHGTMATHLSATERTEEDQDVLPLFLPALLVFQCQLVSTIRIAPP